jgi:hypothetical protein
MGALLSPAPRSLGIVFFCGALAAAGCGGSRAGAGKVVTVSGTVTVGRQPLSAGLVQFIPDPARGNTSRSRPFGLIGADGTYRLITDANPGAPPGWYKVTVSAAAPPGAEVPRPGKQAPPQPARFRAKYANPTTTDLAVEVKDDPAPGAYDLKLTR